MVAAWYEPFQHRSKGDLTLKIKFETPRIDWILQHKEFQAKAKSASLKNIKAKYQPSKQELGERMEQGKTRWTEKMSRKTRSGLSESRKDRWKVVQRKPNTVYLSRK